MRRFNQRGSGVRRGRYDWAGHVVRLTGQLVLAVLFVGVGSHTAAAQRPFQLQGNVTFDWLNGDRLTYSFDLEPKALIVVPPDSPDWRNLDLTPSVEYAAKNWLDLTGEFVAGCTKQTDDENSVELTPRVGVRFHFLSRGLPAIVHKDPVTGRERPPRRRLVVRDWARVEWRNLFYSGDSPNSSKWRFGNRLEFLFPLNRANITMDGARYLQADWQWTVPLGDPKERFANRQRIRAGVGYRRDFHWRFAVLYMWTRSRDTTGEPFRTTEGALNLRVEHFF